MHTEIAVRFGLSEEAPHLKQALTHPSFANEQRGEADNQRLEFLGDAILGAIVCELLFIQFHEYLEGHLT